jgi:hypothetical protein
VPIVRQRVAASGGVQTLGGSAPAAMGGPLSVDQPRLYRPPPN